MKDEVAGLRMPEDKEILSRTRDRMSDSLQAMRGAIDALGQSGGRQRNRQLLPVNDRPKAVISSFNDEFKSLTFTIPSNLSDVRS